VPLGTIGSPCGVCGALDHADRFIGHQTVSGAHIHTDPHPSTHIRCAPDQASSPANPMFPGETVVSGSRFAAGGRRFDPGWLHQGKACKRAVFARGSDKAQVKMFPRRVPQAGVSVRVGVRRIGLAGSPRRLHAMRMRSRLTNPLRRSLFVPSGSDGGAAVDFRIVGECGRVVMRLADSAGTSEGGGCPDDRRSSIPCSSAPGAST
jgi:hypothetical protein